MSIAKLLAFSSIFVSMPNLALGDEWDSRWQLVAVTEDDANVYINTATTSALSPKIGRDFGIRTVWVGFDFRKSKNKKAKRRLDHYNIDCNSQKAFVSSRVEYGARGEIVDQSDDNDDYDFKYQSIPPESVAEAIMNATCSSKPKVDLRPSLDSFFTP